MTTLSTTTNKKIAVKIRTRITKSYVNPYLAGSLLGLVLFLAFFLTGNGLGASGGLNRFVVFFEDLVAPGHIDRTPYLLKMAGGNLNPLDNWIVFLTLGTIIGGFVSGWRNGRLKVETNKGSQISTRARWSGRKKSSSFHHWMTS